MNNRIRELRKQHKMNKGYTMKDMGEKLGISESYYCAIENGDRQKRMDMLIASGLATIFSIPVAKIVSFEKQQSHPPIK